ncbi:hypothetical protein C3479_15475, partial [Mycobacterium kansasii]
MPPLPLVVPAPPTPPVAVPPVMVAPPLALMLAVPPRPPLAWLVPPAPPAPPAPPLPDTEP